MLLSVRATGYSARSTKKLCVTRIMIALLMATLVRHAIRTEAVQAKCLPNERMKSQTSSCSTMSPRQTEPRRFANRFGDDVLRGTCDVTTI